MVKTVKKPNRKAKETLDPKPRLKDLNNADKEELVQGCMLRAAGHIRGGNLVEGLANTLMAIQLLKEITGNQEDRLQLLEHR
jgi:hypothetical protein